MSEKELILSVIARACSDARGEGLDRDKNTIMLKTDANRWLLSESKQPQSFLWYCDLVGLDAEDVRESINGHVNVNI